MKRFFAVVGIVAFLAACSDSNMTSPTTHLQPHAAALDGDPPPPPLSGSGDGLLDFGFGFPGDASTQAPTTNFPPDPCFEPLGFVLSYSFSYLQPDPNNNQVVHLQLDGSPTNGDIVLHQNQNGKAIAQGNISNGSFSFNPQTVGPGATLSSEGFDFTVTGILTDLSTGTKCQVTGDLHGSLVHGD